MTCATRSACCFECVRWAPRACGEPNEMSHTSHLHWFVRLVLECSASERGRHGDVRNTGAEGETSNVVPRATPHDNAPLLLLSRVAPRDALLPTAPCATESEVAAMIGVGAHGRVGATGKAPEALQRNEDAATAAANALLVWPGLFALKLRTDRVAFIFRGTAGAAVGDGAGRVWCSIWAILHAADSAAAGACQGAAAGCFTAGCFTVAVPVRS
jgi:hypothetical protein